MPGSTAAEAGIRAGGRIVAIDGVPCAAQPVAPVNRKLWIGAGAKVEVQLWRGLGKVQAVVLR